MSKKKITIIIISILAAIAVILGAIFLIPKLFPGNPYASMSDSEFLSAIGKWNKKDVSSLVWTFNDDGTGTITTNGDIDTYDMSWQIEGDKLTITTKYLYDMTDEFTLSTDREEKTFTVVAPDKTTTFVPFAEEESAEESSEESSGELPIEE